MLENLGNYASVKANNVHLEMDKITYYFSYKTLVAVRGGGNLVIRANVWGPTTGKHLNAIDSDHTKRVDEETFLNQVENLVKGNK